MTCLLTFIPRFQCSYNKDDVIFMIFDMQLVGKCVYAKVYEDLAILEP